MNLEHMMLNEISQSQKSTYPTILSMSRKDESIERKWTSGCQRLGAEEEWLLMAAGFLCGTMKCSEIVMLLHNSVDTLKNSELHNFNV